MLLLLLVLTWILQAQIQPVVNLFFLSAKQGWEHSAIQVHGSDNATRGDCCQLWLKGCLMVPVQGWFCNDLYNFGSAAATASIGGMGAVSLSL